MVSMTPAATSSGTFPALVRVPHSRARSHPDRLPLLRRPTFQKVENIAISDVAEPGQPVVGERPGGRRRALTRGGPFRSSNDPPRLELPEPPRHGLPACRETDPELCLQEFGLLEPRKDLVGEVVPDQAEKLSRLVLHLIYVQPMDQISALARLASILRVSCLSRKREGRLWSAPNLKSFSTSRTSPTFRPSADSECSVTGALRESRIGMSRSPVSRTAAREFGCMAAFSCTTTRIRTSPHVIQCSSSASETECSTTCASSAYRRTFSILRAW
jgi:hypothetical protein